jgi:P-type Mg2+ transporter
LPQSQLTISPIILECSRIDTAQAVALLNSQKNGLTQEDAEARLEKYGPNNVAEEKDPHWSYRLLRTYYRDPLSLLLTVLAIMSFISQDLRSGVVISSMVVLSILLRFIQEAKANAAASKLKALINVTATVIRNEQHQEIPLEKLVPGDVVVLAAGDMIPADVRILSAKDLFVSQASLTGESFPVEKFAVVENLSVQPLEIGNICFMGTNVESGSATALVAATGKNTYFGGMAKSLTGRMPPTSFDKGVRRFTWLMMGFMLFMAPTVFLINWLTKGNWIDAFMFGLAVAVGLTPEMLPMIVTVCLSKGALAMSRLKVIVKRLNSIQNLGAMDVLCTDKTGTLTLDRVILEKHCDVGMRDSDEVLRLAYMNSYFQTGLKNILDRAILAHEEITIEGFTKIDEVPFDFGRKIMSVVVGQNGSAPRLIVKGAPEEIFRRCTHFTLNGEKFPVDSMILTDLREEQHDLNSDGFRVLAIAFKDLEVKPSYSKADEAGLVLAGYVAFFDPPRDSAAAALETLQRHGVKVKVLTGDNELVTAKICREVGLEVEKVVVGGDIEKLNDKELSELAEKTTIFARLSPANKRRVIIALKSHGHVVGYLGDGINDAPALRAADVGISVDTAVDIAKEAADIILLEKSLLVLEHGVIEGRKVFANILKYIRMGASSNFGNMFSVIGGSAFLPFLPMKPVQVLTNNLLYDFSQVPIPTDEVDQEFVTQPQPWSMKSLARFIVLIGPISSLFDYCTYFMMLYIFDCWKPNNESLFQTGWFVESLATQTLIVHIIRTNRIPFIESRASWPLMSMTVIIISLGIAITFLPIGAFLGFTPLPMLYWPLLALILICYATLCQTMKKWLIKKG